MSSLTILAIKVWFGRYLDMSKNKFVWLALNINDLIFYGIFHAIVFHKDNGGI